MSHTSHRTSSITGLRRTSRLALAAGLATALAATAAAPASAEEGEGAPPPPPAADKPVDEKFSTHDAALLAEAKSGGEKHVTMMIATRPGRTEQVAGELASVAGASVGFTEDEIGYVRVTVRTARADAAISRAQRLSSVYAIDLNEEIEVPDPRPDGGWHAGAPAPGEYPGPGPGTGAKNPYQPAFETGAVDFVEDHPRADGRGITIGVLDTGVDLAHPALSETTTGEPKIVDSVTATDPIVDGDGTWRPMVTGVSGEVFTYNGREYKAPAGAYLVSLFREEVTLGGDMNGDLDRDGDTTGVWALLYDQEAGSVRVDLNDNGDFTDDAEMLPYRENHDVGYFGTDDPDTGIAEAVPFVVEVREDVPMDPYGGDWVGEVRDFVNIGIVSGRHGTHVAGITAAHGLFGGEMNGAAPGAQVVSSRACAFGGGCSYTALFEGMIDLVANRGVDLVNMSIGGLPALNDGNNARARLYEELIDTYDVQLFISAGNSGPGVNTVGDPSVADKVVSVGAGVSGDTWAANYGSGVDFRYSMMPFSSVGPRADGGFKPTITGPGASINSIPTWQEGSAVSEAGYDLPPGYGMLQGTSMSSPQVAGAAALLLSAAERRGIDLDPAALRTALTSSADPIRGVQAHEQGSGLMDTEGAWRLILRGASAYEYTVSAPVDHVLAEFLTTPGEGTGVYDRESAPAVGESETYEVTLTRTTGPDRRVLHRLSLSENHERTFRLADRGWVWLPLDEPVTVGIVAAPRSPGVHSTLLNVNSLLTPGTDSQVLATVVVPEDLGSPSFAWDHSGTAQRNETESFFVRVPEGAATLEVAMDGLAEDSQTRWIAITPWGVPAESTSTVFCYPNYEYPGDTCRPDLRSYDDPIPGVWEIEVESRRTSPLLDNPYSVTATALGTSFDPAVQIIEEAAIGEPTPVSWEVSNGFAPVEGTLEGGELGSALTDRPSIGDGAYETRTVEVPEGASRFEAVIGNPADAAADLDLYVYRDGEVVGTSLTGSSEEAVSLSDPAAGTYTVEVHGYAVPAGSTAYDYRDVFFSSELGEVSVQAGQVIDLPSGATAEAGAEVTVAAGAPAGREFFGEVRLLNAAGTATGAGGVRIGSVAGSGSAQ